MGVIHQVGVEQCVGGSQVSSTGAAVFVAWSCCAITCPLGLQERSAYSFPEDSTIATAGPQAVLSHLCHKGAPQGHVSRVSRVSSIPHQNRGMVGSMG